MSKESKSVASYVSAAGVGLVGIALIGANTVINDYFEREDRAAINDNNCSWEETVADSNSNYKRWASDAIKESNDLGKKVGTGRLSGILYIENDGRDVVSGEKYKILDCKSN